ncbi:MAG: hypothetical protein IKU15_06415 [Clostridia bacterium]|nr:hypothetical protein [Clostridia bacterium]
MSSRKLVRTTTVAVYDGDTEERFVLEYYTLEKESYVDGMSVNTYGIEVLKRGKTQFGTLKVEYRKIFDVFCSEFEAAYVASVLADNTVTPVSVCDIIEQFIGTDEIVCEEYEIAAV